jgi:hypothetical protein
MHWDNNLRTQGAYDPGGRSAPDRRTCPDGDEQHIDGAYRFRLLGAKIGLTEVTKVAKAPSP